MDERLDPVQIIARPIRGMEQDRAQVLGLWMHCARKAGWQVEPVDAPVDSASGECGVVDVEGLRYLIRVGLRGRGRAVTAPDAHVGAFVANAVLEGRGLVSYPVFSLTVWAEPVLGSDER